jgi:hypothetical protein
MEKLFCPNDPTHKRFSASAHEVRGWIVDEDGEWIENDGQGCSMVVAGPDFYGSCCDECGAETEFRDEEPHALVELAEQAEE